VGGGRIKEIYGRFKWWPLVSRGLNVQFLEPEAGRVTWP
jgi:hypothetical protein